MKTKRFYLFLLVALMSVTGAWAQDATSGTIGDMRWEYNTETRNLTFRGLTSNPVDMPDGVDPSSGLEGWYHLERDVESVRFINISRIGASAFAGFDRLSSVVIPNTVETIGEGAFIACYSLSTITIPASVRSLRYAAFEGCTGLTSITVEAETPPEVEEDCFEGVNKSIPVYVPNRKTSAYRAANGWSEFTNIMGINHQDIPEYSLADKSAYSENRDLIVGNFSYTRTFSNTNVWQCWYVPFDATVDETKFKAAEIAGILFDSERNAIVAFNKLDDGAVLKANTPYVVKALTENLEINLTDAILYAAVDNSFTIQSAYDNYTIQGFYSQQSDENCYTLNNIGDFQKMGSATLKPQRFWMSVTPRLDGPYAGNSASAKPVIRMMVLGDDEFGVTGIEGVMQNAASTSSPTGIYNLNGQKVSAPQRGNVYIVNGKKFVMK